MAEKSKILTVTLEINIGDMCEEDLREAGWFDLMDPDESEDGEENDGPPDPQVPLIDEYEAAEIASLLPGAIGHPDAELFAGSGVFVNLGDVRVVSAEWKV